MISGGETRGSWLERVGDPLRVYQVWSNPRIHPFVVDDFSGISPLPELAANPAAICLMPADDSAYFMFVPWRWTMFEVHAAVLPHARPRSAEMGRAALKWMGANSICRTILSFVPKGNYAALALNRALGFAKIGTVAACNPSGGRLRDMTLMVFNHRAHGPDGCGH